MRLNALSFLLCVTAAQPAFAEDLCAAAATVVGARACSQSAHGIVISDTPERASELLAYAEAGVAKFENHFGQNPARFAVVESADGTIEDVVKDGLRERGFTAVLQWISKEGMRLKYEASVRREVESRMAAAPAEARETAVQNSLTRAANSRSESGILSHELGHIWYIMAFWPGFVWSGGHYGGPGPDWMDETAAVLMESSELKAQRVAQFTQFYRRLGMTNALSTASTPLQDDKLLNLTAFFASSHPLTEQLNTRRAQAALANPATSQPRTSGITINASLSQDDIKYYLLATMMSDYFIERSGDPAIFGSISAALSRGQTMDQWLANSDPKGALPRDLTALQMDWLAWLEQRFPAPATPS